MSESNDAGSEWLMPLAAFLGCYTIYNVLQLLSLLYESKFQALKDRSFYKLVTIILVSSLGYGRLVAIVSENEALKAPFDPYEILHIRETSNLTLVKSAYRKLSRQVHPDKKGGDAKTFNLVNAAYRALTTEEGRRNWREFGHPDGERYFSQIKFGFPEWLSQPQGTTAIVLVFCYLGFFFYIGYYLLYGRSSKVKKVKKEDLKYVMGFVHENMTVLDIIFLLSTMPSMLNMIEAEMKKVKEKDLNDLKQKVLELKRTIPTEREIKKTSMMKLWKKSKFTHKGYEYEDPMEDFPPFKYLTVLIQAQLCSFHLKHEQKKLPKIRQIYEEMMILYLEQLFKIISTTQNNSLSLKFFKTFRLFRLGLYPDISSTVEVFQKNSVFSTLTIDQCTFETVDEQEIATNDTITMTIDLTKQDGNIAVDTVAPKSNKYGNNSWYIFVRSQFLTFKKKKKKRIRRKGSDDEDSDDDESEEEEENHVDALVGAFGPTIEKLLPEEHDEKLQVFVPIIISTEKLTKTIKFPGPKVPGKYKYIVDLVSVSTLGCDNCYFDDSRSKTGFSKICQVFDSANLPHRDEKYDNKLD